MINSKENSSIPTSTQQMVLTDIVIAPELQIRVNLNSNVIRNYGQLLNSNLMGFPPVLIFKIDEKFILVDGHHRFEAHKRANKKTISAIVKHGDITTAFTAAIEANTRHGLRLTNADKKHAVTLAIKQRPEQSDRALAEVCLVSDRFVNKVRAALGANGSHVRIGRDGKTYNQALKKKKASKNPIKITHKSFKRFKKDLLKLCTTDVMHARVFAVFIRQFAKEIEDRVTAINSPAKSN